MSHPTAIALAALITLCALPVSAQGGAGRIAAARAALDEARFAEAERLYDAAAASASGMTREDVLALLRGRALARGAQQQRDEARLDLAALVCLEPDADLGESAPPSLRALLEEVRAEAPALRFEVRASGVDGGVEIRTEALDDAGLVRSIRVTDHSGAEPEVHEGDVVVLPTRAETRYSVALIGWGGARLMGDESPRVFRSAAAEGPAGGDDTLLLGVGIGVGAGLAVALAVVLALALSPSGFSQASRPMEIGF